MCLKFLRGRQMMDLYALLQARTGVELEHPLLSELHGALVDRGDFAACDAIIARARDSGYLVDHVASGMCCAIWSPVVAAESGAHSTRRRHAA